MEWLLAFATFVLQRKKQQQKNHIFHNGYLLTAKHDVTIHVFPNPIYTYAKI